MSPLPRLPQPPLRRTLFSASLLVHPLEWSSIETRFTSPRVSQTSARIKGPKGQHQHQLPTPGGNWSSTRTTGTPPHLSTPS